MTEYEIVANLIVGNNQQSIHRVDLANRLASMVSSFSIDVTGEVIEIRMSLIVRDVELTVALQSSEPSLNSNAGVSLAQFAKIEEKIDSSLEVGRFTGILD